jgi:hypothetical protein
MSALEWHEESVLVMASTVSQVHNSTVVVAADTVDAVAAVVTVVAVIVAGITVIAVSQHG